MLFLMPVIVNQAQEFRATAKIDSTNILIGDQVNMKLSFTFPAKAQVLWPSIKDTILGNIRVIDRTKIDSAWSADKKNLVLTQKLRLTCFDSGFYTIPPIRFYYRVLPDTTVRFEQTDLQVLTVHTLSVDTTQAIKPIKGPVKIPVSWIEYLKWIIAGLVFVAVIGFLIYYFLIRKKGEPIFTLKPKIKYLPHEWALMELEKLRVKKLWQAGKVKEYHTDLTDILRKYIEDRFHLKALESTTAEILEDIKEVMSFPTESRMKLGEILSTADLVKFAKFFPGPGDNEKCMEDAVGFITSTYTIKDRPDQEEKTVVDASLTDNASTGQQSVSQQATEKLN
ncbi:MAG: hypothetical protein NTU98_11690 [Bacteroidetes bacterium]|nr:hypothetical protein [Bacteroidota bacterium]